MKANMIGTLAMAMLATLPLVAQSEADPSPGMITVSGEASMDITADRVHIEIVADHTQLSARDAYRLTVKEMSEAVGFLTKRKDVANMRTTQVVLHPRVRDYQKGTKEYNARQSLYFELTDLEKYDELMLSLIEMGINGIGQVQFASSKTNEYEETLMRQAVQDARKKAVILASELGQEVGRATVIGMDRNYGGPGPIYRSMMANDAEMASSGPSVVGGSMKIKKSVNIQFELK